MPRSVKSRDGLSETIYVDGQEFSRSLPGDAKAASRHHPVDPETGLTITERAPGANDPHLRIRDLDQEGIWAELIYPSLNVWAASICDPVLVKAGASVINDWSVEYQSVSPRFVCAATVPLLNIHDATAEVERAAGLGFKAANLPVAPPRDQPPYKNEYWEPMWAAMERAGIVGAFHIGTEPHDASKGNALYHRNPGGAILNYYETTFGGQRAAAGLIAGGVFDRHPDLKVIISEGGATWGPFLADRLDEGYRQHQSAVEPKLRRLPSEYVYANVYASFQHDRSAVAACSAMGWTNVCWGSDYPHIEGTFGHTQKTLHELFDDVDPRVRHRVTLGAFKELFPHIPDPPQCAPGYSR
jgi:predicted TIM-barrel fold metal-dependent hydrolase